VTAVTEQAVCTPHAAQEFARDFADLVANIERSVVGKTDCVRLALACLFTGGHLLLEDVPGTGKTSLAKAIATTVAGDHRRIQFTPDLLPGDVTGGNIYDPRTGELKLRKGPVFTNILLADEINRASPKTQSALLQAMEEDKVTIDGNDEVLSRPFMVIATQNPIEQAGTYPLPEAQLDRFLVRTELGYPDPDATVMLLAESSLRDRTTKVVPLIDLPGVVDRIQLASSVHVEQSVLRYVSEIADMTRPDPRDPRRTTQVSVGVSVRGAMAVVRLARTWAAAQGRNYVLADDVIALAVPVLAHRIVLDVEAEFAGITAQQVIAGVVDSVDPARFGAA
jgi:MoxR-like ATPase